MTALRRLLVSLSAVVVGSLVSGAAVVAASAHDYDAPAVARWRSCDRNRRRQSGAARGTRGRGLPRLRSRLEVLVRPRRAKCCHRSRAALVYRGGSRTPDDLRLGPALTTQGCLPTTAPRPRRQTGASACVSPQSGGHALQGQVIIGPAAATVGTRTLRSTWSPRCD